MKRYFFSLLIIIMQPFQVYSDDNLLFAQAHEYFVKGDFAAALHNYRAMSHKKSIVWQNIGSCYFNQQQYVHALLYWKRAYYDCPIGQVGSLCLLEQKALKKLNLDVPSKTYFLLKQIILMIPRILLQLIFAILLSCLLAVLIRCWRWQECVLVDRRRLCQLLISCFVCCLIWYAQRSFLQKNQAIVVRQDVLVYAGPEQTFHVVKKLRQGNMVRVIEKKQGMYNILQNSLTGWVTQDTLEFIYDYE